VSCISLFLSSGCPFLYEARSEEAVHAAYDKYLLRLGKTHAPLTRSAGAWAKWLNTVPQHCLPGQPNSIWQNSGRLCRP
jgi:hypothetical protein